MADIETTTENRRADGIFSLICTETGDSLITIYRWNTGDYTPVLHEEFKGNKRQRDTVIDAMILLANAARITTNAAISK